MKRIRGDAALSSFRDALAESVKTGTLAKLVFGGPVDASSPKNVTARLVDVKGGTRLQIVEKSPGRDKTSNVDLADAAAALDANLSRYRHADLFTTAGTWRLEQREKQPWNLVHEPAEVRAAPSRSHDREKQHRIGGVDDTPWLMAFGLVSPDGKPTADGKDKLVQIRRFVEILDHLLTDAPRTAPIRVVDMGCGKGHLAVATAVWLARSGFAGVDVVGVELRPALVDGANALVRKFAIPGVRFVAGTIADAPLEGADVVIALHACDTATDDAFARAVAVNARLIVGSPCCHKQVRPQLQAPPGLVSAMRHGILLDRQAELLTDALRADLLGAAGYAARVFEWVATEHTGRNVMIAAERSDVVDRDKSRADALELATTWHIGQQRLAEALGVTLRTGTPAAS